MNVDKLETISEDLLENVSGGTFGKMGLGHVVGGALGLVGGVVCGGLSLVGGVLTGLGGMLSGDCGGGYEGGGSYGGGGGGSDC